MQYPNMGNTDKKKSKKFTRKIRIRLADPNIPDSYICEIFDSSLENEDDDFSKIDNSSQKEDEGPSKPKNYFEVLMSKNCKKNAINTAKESERYKISNDDDDDDEETFQKKKHKSTTKSNSLTHSVDSNRKEIKPSFDSSGNENLFQIQRKNKAENAATARETKSVKELKIEDEETSEDLISIFESPKVDLSGKKKLSILNYFSKTEATSNGTLKHQKCKEDLSEKSKTCQSNNNKKQQNNDTEKLSANATKKMFLNGINKENQKLAPLFCRKETKVADLAKQRARLEFLYRGSPSTIKKSETKVAESIFHFPKVTHVQQRNESVYWSFREISLPLPKVLHPKGLFNGNKKFRLEIRHSNAANRVTSEHSVSCTKELLCKMKCKYVGLNLDLVIDGLKEKRDRFLERVEGIEKSKLNSLKTSSDEMGFEELNTLWTEKYKPKSSEILGNANTVKKLRKWLQSWKTFDDELKVLVRNSQNSKGKQDSEDDEDEFMDLNSENYGLKAPGNVCIISGPNGCGKTSLVYALANELEFGVLELNASSKRTGKKVLSNLQEATQSHKVQRVNLLQNVAAQAETKKKSKKLKKKSEPVKFSEQINDSKISLILIEDADIVFEDHDEGFYSAIVSLVQTSKRPLIFLANEPNCPYLESLKLDQSLVLEMERPSFYKSCAVLDIVSSLEGVHFEKELLEVLVSENSFDLRKSLLELQFWSGSGSKLENIQKVFDLGHLWWGLSKFLFKQDIRHFVKSKGRKRKRANDLFDSSDDETETSAKKFKSEPEYPRNFCSLKADAGSQVSDHSIESYFGVLDLASKLDGFNVAGSEEPVPGNECRPKDSLSLDENLEEVLWSRRLSEQLSNEMMSLSARIFLRKFNEKENEERKLSFTSPCWEEIRWRNCQWKASEELSNLVSLQRGRDKRSLYLDYLPILRNICRVEKHRAEINPKRKNRFYHYLNNLGFEFTEENLEINCQVFNR